MTEIPTRPELAEIDDVLLKRVTEIWRAQALRGDTRASGIARALESFAVESSPFGALELGPLIAMMSDDHLCGAEP